MELKKINLDLSCEATDGNVGLCDHPHIKLGVKYLVRSKDARGDPWWAIGEFEREWYGLNFDGFYDAGLQLDHITDEGGQVWEITSFPK